MLVERTRRRFLADIGKGMLIASLGQETAIGLGLSSAMAGDDNKRLSFGSLEPLVELIQETPPAQLQSILVDRLRSGASLREMVAAAALANARAFGGEDYIGFHTMMALAPAHHIAMALPKDRQPLPVLKVLYRNSHRIQEAGGSKKDVLQPIQPDSLPANRPGGEVLRDAVRGKNVLAAERTFAALARGPASDAFNQLLFAVQDNTEVHRVVLPYRAWDLLDLIGQEHAHTLLRQSVRYCVKSERDWRHDSQIDEPRTLLPTLLDRYHLLGKSRGTREADNAWIEAMSRTIFDATPSQAAEAAASALAEGIRPEDLGEAISVAANQLVLRDRGRTAREAQPNKPLGSVHGDSIGVHACDSANAWRNMARISNWRNTAACLILGAYQVALDRTARGGDFLHWRPWPVVEDQEKVQKIPVERLLAETEAAIRANDQARACALVGRYGSHGLPERPVFDLLCRYAISEDGALHAEKYFQTVVEEFQATRPEFRWRQLIALARVTASEYGRAAPGYAEARALLKLA